MSQTITTGNGKPAPHYDHPTAKCSGIWACDGRKHCVCWWDRLAELPSACCQCGPTK